MAVKTSTHIKLFILFSLFNLGLGTNLYASHEEGSARLSSIAINSAVFIQDNKYPAVAGMPTTATWGFYDVSYKNKLILGIDRYSTLAIANFVATVTVEITSSKPLAIGGGGTTVITKTLSVSYEGKNDHQSASTHASVNDAVFSFTNGYAVLTRVTGISVSINGGAPTTTMPNNVYLQSETDAERYYPINQNANPLISSSVTINYIPLSDEFEISWGRINGAEEYDLEWLWLDAAKNSFWAINPEIDFRNNSTRVRTSQQSYRVSNIFEKGQVFFRIRGVGKSGLTSNTYDKDAYSSWTWPDLTTVPTAVNTSTVLTSGANNLFYITLDGATNILTYIAPPPTALSLTIPPIHETNKNWQYKATYAEEGKKKEVISYFDGTLRSRQSVTKNNSDNNAIVGESYYDYNGRAVVQALPVPVADPKIKFYQNYVTPTAGGTPSLSFNVELTSKLPYGKQFFDKDGLVSSTPVCTITAAGLNDSYGTAQYYSSNNPFITQSSHGYVPDAEHLPISQTEFTNDNTGRIARQGGVGKAHQLETDHETKYFYGTPEQIELDRLFGSEVGYNKHYKKNMVVDANGQVSISYLDQEGRTIATALSGQGPTNLLPVTDHVGNPLYANPTGTNIINADLLNKANVNDFDTNKDNNNRIGDELTFSKKILVPTAGTYTLSYDLKGTSYTYSCLPTNACYDCVYDLEINVFDNCLNNPAGFTKITRTLGNIIPPTVEGGSATVDFTLDAVCGQTVNFATSQLSFSGSDLLVYLEQGDYTITKTLKVNKDALTYYLNDYLQSNCVKVLDDFKEGLEPDTSGCSLTCDECIEALGTQAAYILAGSGTAEDWLREYQICKEPCEFESLCEVEYLTMLADVSPGGQYGDWEDGNGDCDPSLHNLSVYNQDNVLPKIKMVIAGTSNFDLQQPDWRNPHYRLSVYSGNQVSDFKNEYRDDEGHRATVDVIKIGVNTYSPSIRALATPTAVAGSSTQFIVYPEDLLNVSDFISRWKNSWAKSLVYYHPEYGYYDWCLKNSTKKVTPFFVTNNEGSNYISSSDDYDSLLMVTDDIIGLSTTDLEILCNPINVSSGSTNYDPYWTTNGKYYLNTVAAQTATIGTVDQLTNAAGLTFPWKYRFSSANMRFFYYQNSAVSLPVFAAIITTSCAIQYGQPITPNQLTCLVNVLNSTSGPITFNLTNIITASADDILLNLPSTLQNKYWDNFRMMYLGLKQEMQQEAAESYAMNGDYKGCNDGIGNPAFDPMAMEVPFTHYYIFGPYFGFPGNSFLNQFVDQWFFPFHTPNESQYCNVFSGNLYHGKIKRFPNAKNATDLSNNLSAGNPGASIYASTGLCPNAFYFQNLINSLGTSNQLANSTINLSAVPEFNQDLYTVVAGGVIPTTYTQADWTNTSTTAMSISANMQIGSNPVCPITLTLPTTYTTGTTTSPIYNASPFTFANTGLSSGSTYAFLRIYHLVPTTTTGGMYNFTMVADITATSGSSNTFTTVVLSGSTCIPLTGCTFTPPCAPTTAAIALQKLMNAIAATGNMCSANSVTPILMSDVTLQPYFLNSFGPALGSGTWQWEKISSTPLRFVIKDGAGSNPNTLQIDLGTVPCMTSGNTFAFANVTGNNTASNIFNITIKEVPASLTTTIIESATTGTVTLGGQPLAMGICGFDNVKCATIPHQTRTDMETFLLSNGTRPILQSGTSILTSNYKFGFNLRNQLADNYQTYNSTSLNTNAIYYYWNKNTAVTSSTIIAGSFFASIITPVPSTPSNSCDFSLRFANPAAALSAGHNLNTGTYSLSNFTLATSPLVNLSVFDFSVTATFGATSYTLLGTSSCFGMRPCGECTSVNGSGGYATQSVINNFPCTGAPSFTIGGNAVYTPVTNCQSTPRINNLEHTTGSSVEFGDGPHTVWNAYNGGSGDNGTSFFIWHAIETEFAYRQNFIPAHSCSENRVKFKIHKKAAGVSFTSSDFNVRINGVPITFYSITNINSEWDEMTFGTFSTTSGVPFTFAITDFSSAINDFLALDDIILFPIECSIPPIPCVHDEQYEPFPEIEYEDPCVQYALDIVDNDAQELYSTYLDSIKKAFVQGYIRKCMGEAIENFYEKYNAGDYHYTLYYYDQAGNLVRTVPPEGVTVEINTTNLATIKSERNGNLTYGSKTYFTTHNLQTTYTYNSLNQLVKQETPDGGISHFWYDALGRLVASQNAKQLAKASYGSNYYSYTHYDGLGRISQVGEMITPYDFITLETNSPSTLAGYLNPTGGNYPDNMIVVKTEVTHTYYGDDAAFTPLIAGSNFTSGSQDYVRSRVTSVTIEDVDDATDNTYNHGTHYSYDIHGNVKELIQENKDIPVNLAYHQLKKMNYTYDLISGKVNTVAYQPGHPDMFLHRYEYDADNRITNVFTSKDNIIWDQDAKYFYYLHGPLSRVEIGHDKVQATDYAYSIQGWIKGVNSNILVANNDIGKDGTGTLTSPTSGGTASQIVNKYNARDVFGYSLTYFNNTLNLDYLAINSTTGGINDFIAGVGSVVQTPDLYNGNIRQMVTSYLDASSPAKTYNTASLLKNYAYDQLNRIKTANAFDGLNLTSNSWPGTTSVPNMYNENFTYDQNGNIKFAQRNGNALAGMDNLTYNYLPNTNKLDNVTDAVSGTPYGNDFSSGQNSGNYDYDEIGNLIKDVSENIVSIEWTVYGKIKKIVKKNGVTPIMRIDFKYDASGNRISKSVLNGTAPYKTITHYMRDAQGNVMATYLESNYGFTDENNSFKLQEQHIYGSSRLGLISSTEDLTTAGPIVPGSTLTEHVLGIKSYELSNHLGNVLAVVSDRKIAVDINADNIVEYFTGEVISATDYYSFGSTMPNRHYSNGNSYRYGFNGMEKDNEVKGEGNSYTSHYRGYDSRLGRWYSVDPAIRSNVSSYIAFSNNPIIKVDPRGDDDFFDKNGKLVFSTKVGNAIHVLKVSNEAFFNALAIATPIFTAKLKAEQAIKGINHFLESVTVPMASIDYSKKENYRTITNIMRHYYSEANLTNNDGSYIDPVDAIGGVVNGDWNAVTTTAPVELLGKKRPTNFQFGAIYLTKNSAGKINPAFNNKHNLITILVHENSHLKGNAAGDEDPRSHLNAYREEIDHESWKQVDLNSDYAKGTIGKIGYLLYFVNDGGKLKKEFEDKLGVNIEIKYKSPEDEKGMGSVETTYQKK